MLLGADGVVATRMEIVDGHYTGKIDYYAYGENKASALERLAIDHHYDLTHSYATARGWPVLIFTRPVTLRSRMRLPQGRSTLAALAIATAVVAGAATYLAVRRSRTVRSWVPPEAQTAVTTRPATSALVALTRQAYKGGTTQQTHT